MPDEERGARTITDLALRSLPNAGVEAAVGFAVRGIAVDSRLVRRGDLFVAMPGTASNGALYAAKAVEAGAVALVVSPDGLERVAADIGLDRVPVFVADNVRLWAARLAARYWNRQPEVIAAVTGTNGKTSTTHFLRQIWEAAGERAVSFGTTGVTGAGFDEPLAHTTPEPVTLHALLARLAAAGVTHAAMEASSHGLAQHRLDGVHLSAAGLTNITRDHLDYHADFEAYAAAKLRLFSAVLERGGAAVLNADAPVFERARAVARSRGQRVIAVGRSPGADLRLLGQQLHAAGQVVVFGWGGAEHEIPLALVGDFQAENVGLAAGLAIGSGTPSDAVFAALPRLTGVRGRMELAARTAAGASVFVDYAHTPDALRSALTALRPHCAGRLVCVFGAGGDRDAGKRPLMGEAVAAAADLAIVTDDNPRGEDPARIRAAVAAGAPGALNVAGRAAAIREGIARLGGPGDCLLIAGKGHEQGQEIGGRILPFDDVEEARKAVRSPEGAA